MNAATNQLTDVSFLDRSKVMTEATLNAAALMEISDVVLSEIIGVSAATLSRGRKSMNIIGSNKKAMEMSVLFVRIYRSLEAFASSDIAYVRRWLNSENRVLHGRPLELMATVVGIMAVVNYLDGARAKI